ncbi:MAG: GFA family protein [Leptotrichiaceae bacterium]|nr:GFA family protein [Leptotrichiaceae bacterium]MBP7100939.1 GFA family protein [Leptotrichiaceae bacterium]MBP7739494.1 GFA family protein [Leptotrichiaceae bacterium]
MILGSCLCGLVKYQSDMLVGPIIFCHCSFCRKSSSSSFSSNSIVDKDTFKVVEGEEYIQTYESSPGKVRHFCSNCHTQLFHSKEGVDKITLKLGTVDTITQDISGLEKFHINCESDRVLTQYENLPKYELGKK